MTGDILHKTKNARYACEGRLWRNWKLKEEQAYYLR